MIILTILIVVNFKPENSHKTIIYNTKLYIVESKTCTCFTEYSIAQETYLQTLYLI